MISDEIDQLYNMVIFLSSHQCFHLITKEERNEALGKTGTYLEKNLLLFSQLTC